MASELDRAAVEARRDSIDVNLFQGYDVRGDAQPHSGRSRPNFLPEDAFLIAEAIGSDFIERGRTATPELRPRALVTGDHRPSTPALRDGVVAGLVAAGATVEVSSEPVPTGAASREALLGDYDVTIQITGSHNPSYNNGMKITTKQNREGFHDPDGVPSALYGNKRLRPFELIHVYDRIRRGRPEPVDGGSSTSRGGIVEAYQKAFLARFREILAANGGRFGQRFRVVVDAGNGLGAAIVPILEGLDVEVEPLFVELDGTFPNHPADPSKAEGVRAAQEVVRARNAQLEPGAARWIALAFDGDGDRCGVIDEGGEVLYPERILVILYRRFLLENRAALERVRGAGDQVELALDVRASGVVRDILARYREDGLGIGGRFIPAGYPSHRRFVRDQLARVRELAARLDQEGDAVWTALQETYTSAEASGHFFYATAPESPYPDLVIDDGIFAALKLLQLVDTLGSHEARESGVRLPPDQSRYGLDELFASVDWKPVSDEIRGAAPLEDREKFAVVTEVETAIRDGAVTFRQPIADLIGRDQIEDGVRVEFADGSFLLVRASNTSPKFTYKFEAATQPRLVEVIEEGLELMRPYVERGAGIDELGAELARQRSRL